jgi:hypothetical protein
MQGEALRRDAGGTPDASARRAQTHRMQRQEGALATEPPGRDPVPAARRGLESQRLQFRMLEGGGAGRPVR